MSDFEITVIVFLYLIWGQQSKLVKDTAMWLTRQRRRRWRQVRGK